MHTSRTRLIALATLAAMLTTVCNLPSFTPATPTPEPTPVVEVTTAPGEVIIPPTTKVADPVTAEALESVSADGTLTFANNAAGLEQLAPGDVLVFDSTDGAPEGLLRKVRTTRVEGEKLVVETEGALLTEAVHQGQISFVQELKEEDIRATEWLQPGVQFQAASLPRAPGLQSAPFSPPTRPRALSYTFDSDLGTGGQMRVRGNATLKPILDVDLWISCNRKVLGVCAEIPDLNFKTRVGIEESTSLTITGNVANSFDRETEIARHTFSPLTFSIGPVPVVFVPVLKVYLKGDGTLTASMSYAVRQELKLVAGFRYNSDSGFEDLSERTANFSQTDRSFAGSVDVKGALGVKFELRLYGVLGPFGSLEAGAHFNANLNGLPPDSSLMWKIEGCLLLNVGIDSIDVLDIHYAKELYKGCANFGTGANNPPIVYITSPNTSSQIYQGLPFALRGAASDPDGGTATCRWTSNNSGDPFPVTGCELSVVFQSQGSRTLTLTGTDQAGKTASAAVTVNVLPPPAVLVNISNPLDGGVVGPNEVITLQGSASGGAGPYNYTWKIAFPTDNAGNGGTLYTIASGESLSWKPSDTLPITGTGCEINSPARLILEARDANGFTGTRTILIRIQMIC